MSVAATRWYPPSENDFADARSLFDAAVQPCLRAWFNDAAVRFETVAPIAPRSDFTFPNDAQVWSCGQHVWWAVAPRAFARLANRALDLPEHLMKATQASRPEALTLFEKTLADALFDALAAAAGIPPVTPQRQTDSARAPLRLAHGGAHFRLLDERSGDTLLSIACATPRVWEHRAALRQPSTDSPPVSSPLSTRADALAAVKCSVSAMLGQAELTIAELLDLAPGDVIALGRPLEAPISLVVGEAGYPPSVIGAGHLGRSGEQLSIQMNAIESQDQS
ncbi:MAG TPA: FliM/FliN family flagellar motor switch protein [Trinickia sp.]|nr:FliM/FliN family flagellar motor switch protein [Trinickia sp.]